jgi:hypothetical protein
MFVLYRNTILLYRFEIREFGDLSLALFPVTRAHGAAARSPDGAARNPD